MRNSLIAVTILIIEIVTLPAQAYLSSEAEAQALLDACQQDRLTWQEICLGNIKLHMTKEAFVKEVQSGRLGKMYLHQESADVNTCSYHSINPRSKLSFIFQLENKHITLASVIDTMGGSLQEYDSGWADVYNSIDKYNGGTVIGLADGGSLLPKLKVDPTACIMIVDSDNGAKTFMLCGIQQLIQIGQVLRRPAQ